MLSYHMLFRSNSPAPIFILVLSMLRIPLLLTSLSALFLLLLCALNMGKCQP